MDLQAHPIDLSEVRAQRDFRAETGADAGAASPRLEIGPTPDTPVVSGSGTRFRSAVLGSLLLHGLLAAWFFLPPWSQGPGLGGDSPDAISIDVVSADALDALGAKQIPAAGLPGSAIDDRPGPENPMDQPEIAAAPEKKPDPPLEKPPEALAKPDPVAEPDMPAAEVVKAAPEPPVTEALVEPAPKTEKPPDTVEAPPEIRPPQTAIVTGATPAAPQTAVVPAEAAARQASGDAARFALVVRQALGKSRPRHRGTKGRVVITFGLGESGSVRFAEVTRSSGNSGLDAVTLAAVRTATFPRPPASLTDRQRTYVVPFDFK
jgi:TonB family protein